jgi:hypothetical protein
VLLLLGGRRPRGRDAGAPVRLRPERYIYSFLVAIVLFSVGGLFALYEAYHKFHEVHAAHGHPRTRPRLRWWWVPLVVLVASIVMERSPSAPRSRETNKTRARASSRAVHPARQAARAAGDPARGLRGLIGLVLASSASACPSSPATATSTSPVRRPSDCSW